MTQKMSPEPYKVPGLWTLKMYFMWQQGTLHANVIKNLNRKRLSGTIAAAPRCSHMSLCEGDVEGNPCASGRGRHNVTASHWSDVSQIRGHGQPPAAGEAWKRVSLEPLEEVQPSGSLDFDLGIPTLDFFSRTMRE